MADEAKVEVGLEQLHPPTAARRQYVAWDFPAAGPIEAWTRSEFVQDLRAYLEKHSITRSQVARELGVSPATLSAVLGLAYKGDVDGMLRKLCSWWDQALRRAEANREKSERRRFVFTYVAREIDAAAKMLVDAPGRLGIVYGPAGIGKSLMAEYIRTAYPGAIVVQLTEDERSYYQFARLLAELAGVRGTAKRRRGEPPLPPLARQTVDKLKGSGRLAVIDEAHLLADRALNLVKNLIDLAKLPVLLLGTIDLKHRFRRDQRPDLGQLSSRVYFCKDLTKGRDPMRGDTKRLFTVEDIRAILQAGRVRLLSDAIHELHRQCNLIGFGCLRRGEMLIEIAARIARLEHKLAADEAVSLGLVHIQKAQAWMAEDVLPALPEPDVLEPAAATA